MSRAFQARGDVAVEYLLVLASVVAISAAVLGGLKTEFAAMLQSATACVVSGICDEE